MVYLCNGSSVCRFSSVKCFKMRLFKHSVSSKACAMCTFLSFPIIDTNTLANRCSVSGFPIRIRLTCRTSLSVVNTNWTAGVFGVLQRVLPHNFLFMLFSWIFTLRLSYVRCSSSMSLRKSKSRLLMDSWFYVASRLYIFVPYSTRDAICVLQHFDTSNFMRS